MHELNIDIAGTAGAGKTMLALMLYRILEDKGCTDISVIDEFCEEESTYIDLLAHNAAFSNTKVNIKTTQTRRPVVG